MKLYKYNNGRGDCALSVSAITSIWPVDKGELGYEYKDCYAISYLLLGGHSTNVMYFEKKENRDMALKTIIDMMEHE